MIPLFYLEPDGLNFISIVENPANEEFFIKLSKSEKIQLSADKQIITGLVISPDIPIYRRNGDQEYYIAFKEEAVKQLAKKIIENPKAVDLQHNGNPVDGVSLLEIYLKDTSRGINPKGFEDVPDGSLFVSYKIDNPALWEALKIKDFGFSLDGIFHREDDLEEIYKMLNKIKNFK